MERANESEDNTDSASVSDDDESSSSDDSFEQVSINRPIWMKNQLQFLKDTVLKVISKQRYARLFHGPVDTHRPYLPEYHRFIKHPMDLQSIEKKLEDGYYRSGKECIQDFNIMFKNSYVYMQAVKGVVDMARSLETLFLTKVANMPKKGSRNQLKYLKETVLKVVWKHESSWPFRQLVVGNELHFPRYHKIIKNPMDLVTIKERLKNNYYLSANECIEDFKTMFSNCFIFCKAGKIIVDMTREIETVFIKTVIYMPKKECEVEPPVTNQLKFLKETVLNTLWKHECARPYRHPANTVKPYLDEYHKTITYPIDLATIKKRLKSNYYWSGDECMYDLRTMFTNHSAFRDKEMFVVDMAMVLEEVLLAKLMEMPYTTVENQLKFLEETVLATVLKHPYALAFQKPVPKNELDYPEYHKHIRNPMDLGTIMRRLKTNYYRYVQECIYDFHTVINNCFVWYSEMTKVVVDKTTVLEELFQRLTNDFPEEEYVLYYPSAMRTKCRKRKRSDDLLGNITRRARLLTYSPVRPAHIATSAGVTRVPTGTQVVPSVEQRNNLRVNAPFQPQ